MCYIGCIAHFQIVGLEQNILCAAFILLCVHITIIVQMRTAYVFDGYCKWIQEHGVCLTLCKLRMHSTKIEIH